jgi:RNA polymerase sigma-70 factor (ECF subfamily)
LDERELVEGLRERRDDAVSVFLERYRPLFQHCIANFESDPTTREDLFQDLVWHVLERLQNDSFDPARGSFGTWAYRVAWCRCVDLKRKTNAARRVRVSLPGDELPEQVDPSGPLPESIADREIGRTVRHAIAQLPPEERQLLVLRFVEHRTLIDIAAELSITVEQTKYRLKRAASALRKELLSRLPRSELAE